MPVEFVTESNDLNIAIGSMSCITIDPRAIHEIVFPKHVSGAIVARSRDFLEAMKGCGFKETDTSLSLHPGLAVNTPVLVEQAYFHGLRISSVDMPDIDSPWQLIKEVTRAALTGNPKEAVLSGGWFLQNVPTLRQQRAKMEEALTQVVATPPKQLPVIRCHSGAWINSREGDQLVDTLKDYPGITVAVEIDSSKQTLPQYWSFIDKLSRELAPFKIKVGIDGDLAHWREVKDRHPELVIDEPLTIFEKLLADPARRDRLVLLSLNQYVPGSMHTHSDLITGPINLQEAARQLGQAQAAGKLRYPSLVLPEFYPTDYERMVSDEGLDYFRSIKQSYDQGLKAS